MSTVFNFWVLNLGSIGSLLSQGDLVDSFLPPAEQLGDQDFEFEPDFAEEPDTVKAQEPVLAEPEGVAGLEPEPEESDGSAGDDPDPEAEQPDAIAEIISLPNQDDLAHSFLSPEEPPTDQDFEFEPDFVEELEPVEEQEPELTVPEGLAELEPEINGTDLNPAAPQTDTTAGIGSLPNIVTLPNLDELLNSLLPPTDPVTDVDPEPEPEVVDEQDPAPGEPDGEAGSEPEIEESDTTSESNAGGDPSPETEQTEPVAEEIALGVEADAPGEAAESAPELTTSTSTTTTSTSTSTSTSGGSSSMVTSSSVNRVEVTQQASAVVAIAAGIDLRTGGKQGRDTFRFTLTRSGDSTGESSVAWAVKGRGDNPATARDFRGKQLPSGTVTFAAGETSRSVSVRVRPTDGQKGFALSLGKARGAVLGRSEAQATIAPRDTLIGSDSDDRIQGSSRREFIEGRRGQDLLTGGGRADRFGFRYGDSQVASPDRITDFRFGEDRIAVRNGQPRRFSRAADNSSASSLEDLAAAVFADANGRSSGKQALGSREAALVVSTKAQIAGTYLLINNGKAGLNPRNDLLIDVSGFSGDLPGLGRIDPGLVFG